MPLKILVLKSFVFGLSALFGAVGLLRFAHAQEEPQYAYMCRIQCGKTAGNWLQVDPESRRLDTSQGCEQEGAQTSPLLFSMTEGPMIITKDGESTRVRGVGITARMIAERTIKAKADQILATIRSYPDVQHPDVQYTYRKAPHGKFLIVKTVNVKRIVQLEPVPRKLFFKLNEELQIRCENRMTEQEPVQIDVRTGSAPASGRTVQSE